MSMAMIPTGYVNPRLIESEIERAIQKLGPEVVRVKYKVGEDTSGEPAIYFRIVLVDSAAGVHGFGDVAENISDALFDELRPNENWGLRSYFRYRSQSEQAKMNDPDWA